MTSTLISASCCGEGLPNSFAEIVVGFLKLGREANVSQRSQHLSL